LIGTTPKELLALFEKRSTDQSGRHVFPNKGHCLKRKSPEFIKQGGFTKPLISAIAGRFTEQMPEGILFGHSGQLIYGGYGKPSTKIEMLKRGWCSRSG